MRQIQDRYTESGDSIIGHETKGTCEYRPQQNATIVKIKLTSQDQRFRLQTRQNAEAKLVDAQIDVMPLTKSMISRDLCEDRLKPNLINIKIIVAFSFRRNATVV